MLLILKSYQKGKTLFCIWCKPTQNSSALYIFHKFIQKPAVHCTFSTRLYTNHQCTLRSPHDYTQTSSELYIFHTFIHKPAVHCTISTRLYRNQQCIVHFPYVYTLTSSALYIFHKFIHKPAVHSTVFRWFIPVVRAYKYIGKWI